MAILLGGGKVQSRGKTYSSYDAYQKKSKSTTSKSTTSTTSTPSSKVKANVAPTSNVKALTGIDFSKLTQAQRDKLQEKGYDTSQPEKSTAPKVIQPQAVLQTQTPQTSAQVNQATSQALGSASLMGLTQGSYQFPKLPGANNGLQWFQPTTGGGSDFITNAYNKYADASRGLVQGLANPAVEQISSYYGLGGREKNQSLGEAFKTGLAITELVPGLGAGLKAIKTVGKVTKITSLLNKARNLGKNVLDDVVSKLGGSKNIGKATDDAIKAVSKQLDNIPPKPPTKPPTPPKPGLSNLGNIARGTVATGIVAGAMYTAYDSYTGAVRNATTPTTSTSTVGDTATDTQKSTDTKTTDSTSTTDSSFETTSSPMMMSSPSSFTTSSGTTSGVSGGGTSGGGSAGGGGGIGGGFVGEPQTSTIEEARKRAEELQRAQGTQASVTIPEVGDEVDLQALTATKERTKELLQQYGAQAATMPEFQEGIKTLLAAGIANIKKIQPTPPEPVVDTPEQFDAINQSADPTGMRAQMDSIRKSLGMTQMEAQRIDVMQQLQAVQETYQSVIDDIKKNPNFPKGLAARRMTEIFEQQKFATNSLIAQLDQIDRQLDDANNRLNQEMGIWKEEQDMMEKERMRRVDQFGYLLDSGAIGGLNDTEIQQWSAVTGIPESAIRSLKTQAGNVKTEYTQRYEKDPNTGDMYIISTDKNNPLAEPIITYAGNFGATRSQSTATKEEKNKYTSKDMPSNVSNELLADMQDVDFLKQYGGDDTQAIIALSRLYPEVSLDTIEDYWEKYRGEVPEEEEKDNLLGTMWNKVSNLWNKE